MRKHHPHILITTVCDCVVTEYWLSCVCFCTSAVSSMLLTSSIYAFISALWTSSRPSLREWPWEHKHGHRIFYFLLLTFISVLFFIYLMTRLRNYEYSTNITYFITSVTTSDKCLNMSLTHTLAFVNCTIGPSSDTTWFPTWIKGILPTERQKKTHAQKQTIKKWQLFLKEKSQEIKKTAVSRSWSLIQSELLLVSSTGTVQTTNTETYMEVFTMTTWLYNKRQPK